MTGGTRMVLELDYGMLGVAVVWLTSMEGEDVVVEVVELSENES